MNKQWSFVVKLENVRSLLNLGPTSTPLEHYPTNSGEETNSVVEVEHLLRFYFDGKEEHLPFPSPEPNSDPSPVYRSPISTAFTYNILSESVTELFNTLRERFVTCQLIKRARIVVNKSAAEDESLDTEQSTLSELLDQTASRTDVVKEQEVVLFSATLSLIDLLLSRSPHFYFDANSETLHPATEKLIDCVDLRKSSLCEEWDMDKSSVEEKELIATQSVLLQLTMEEKTYIEAVFKEIHLNFEKSDVPSSSGELYSIRYGPQYQILRIVQSHSLADVSGPRNSVLSSINQSGRAFSISVCNTPVSRTEWYPLDSEGRLTVKNTFLPVVVHSTLSRFIAQFKMGILVESRWEDVLPSSSSSSSSLSPGTAPATPLSYFELDFESMENVKEDIMESISVPFRLTSVENDVQCEGIVNLMSLPSFKAKAVFLQKQWVQRQRAVFTNPFLSNRTRVEGDSFTYTNSFRGPSSTTTSLNNMDGTTVSGTESNETHTALPTRLAIDRTLPPSEKSSEPQEETVFVDDLDRTVPEVNGTLSPTDEPLPKSPSQPRTPSPSSERGSSPSYPSCMPTPPVLTSPPPRKSAQATPTQLRPHTGTEETTDGSDYFEEEELLVPSTLTASTVEGKSVQRTLLTDDKECSLSQTDDVEKENSAVSTESAFYRGDDTVPTEVVEVDYLRENTLGKESVLPPGPLYAALTEPEDAPHPLDTLCTTPPNQSTTPSCASHNDTSNTLPEGSRIQFSSEDRSGSSPYRTTSFPPFSAPEQNWLCSSASPPLSLQAQSPEKSCTQEYNTDTVTIPRQESPLVKNLEGTGATSASVCPMPPKQRENVPFKRRVVVEDPEEEKSPSPRPAKREEGEERFFDFGVAGLTPSPPKYASSSAARSLSQYYRATSLSSHPTRSTKDGHTYCLLQGAVPPSSAATSCVQAAPPTQPTAAAGVLPTLWSPTRCNSSPSVRALSEYTVFPSRYGTPSPDPVDCFRVAIVKESSSKHRSVGKRGKKSVAELRLETFQEAIQTGDVKLMKHLFFTDGSLVHQNDELLHMACSAKEVNPECLHLLITARPELVRGIDTATCGTVLHFLCSAEYHNHLNEKALRMLLLSGVAAGVKNADGMTALHLCVLFPFKVLELQSDVLFDTEEMVEEVCHAIDVLLALGNVTVNDRTARKETPLHLVCKQIPKKRNAKTVENIAMQLVYFLSTRGADPSLITPYNRRGSMQQLTPGEMAQHVGLLRVSAFLDGLTLNA